MWTAAFGVEINVVDCFHELWSFYHLPKHVHPLNYNVHNTVDIRTTDVQDVQEVVCSYVTGYTGRTVCSMLQG